MTLQINVAPPDLRHVREILPHELRQLGDQVDEVLLVMDVNRNRLGDPAVWRDGAVGLREFAESLRGRYPHLRLIDVDSSPETAAKVAQEFSGGKRMPQKDWRGAPIYPYFFGVWAARNNYVFHMDSDMLYGGGSQTWVREAVELMRSGPDVLFCSPLPGPPTASGELLTQTLPREPLDTLAFRADQVSTRVFMIDRRRFKERVGAIDVVAPARDKVWLARLDGYQPFQCAEVLLSSALVQNRLARIDFLGQDPGLWSLHPPYRSELFYDMLPNLISRIESGDVADGQRGDFDLNDSMVDWSSARKPRWRRMLRHGELALRNLVPGGRRP
ncbi:MAG TPA: hypothetical protein VHU61_15540 [Solirubrobacteraceae bacterium]|nr:hypothetical protein [Solirubrobacteraceae bacterium]